MIESLKATKYRAVLGDADEPEFLIVTVVDNGSISWTVVTEQVYADSGCDDLPQDLFGQVNAVYGKLQISGGGEDDLDAEF